MRYKNKKTGGVYLRLATGIDTTNCRDGITVVIYCPVGNKKTIFVRDLSEFNEKFTLDPGWALNKKVEGWILMSTKYRFGSEVPSEVIISRLNELAEIVTLGAEAISKNFTMNIPAQVDHDADLVLSAAACRIKDLEHRLSLLLDETE